MRTVVMGCAVAALTVLAARSEARPAEAKLLKSPTLTVITRQVGVASWYGPGFQGRPTASGQPYDMNAMTCAHRRLPLGTRIVVTNLLNAKSVMLKVTDRGPYVGGRVLDVSRVAAKRLGFLGAGLAAVRIRVVSYPRYCALHPPIPTVVASTAN